MRNKASQHMLEMRVAKRYGRLHVPLIELIQGLEDLVPQGSQLGSKVELTQAEGFINVVYTARPVEFIIDDGIKKMTLKIEPSRP